MTGPKIAAQRDYLRASELLIVRLVWREKANQEIADALCISLKTVETHIRNIMEVLKLHSRVGLALWYERQLR